MIYYIYDKTTGIYMGSGTEKIENEQFGATTTPPSPEILEVLEPPPLRYDAEKDVWVRSWT
jgi:hypothetical protein